MGELFYLEQEYKMDLKEIEDMVERAATSANTVTGRGRK